MRKLYLAILFLPIAESEFVHHRPTEVTSKRPVSRLREVIEVKKSQPRDPRFLPVTGDFDSRRFAKQYDFLTEIHASEMQTLRDNLKRARKLLINSPRDTRDERTAEVVRLEQALKRAESAVSRDKRERIEREALQKAKQEEKERRKEGKGEWYMKDGASRENDCDACNINLQ
jgi:ribosomal RNA-processing protein 36